MIVLQEVAAGRLDLHVSVNEILPWLELPGAVRTDHAARPDDPHRRPARRHGGRARPVPGALHRLQDEPGDDRRGERWLYSNDGWKVVGACLEEVTGRAGPRAAAHARARIRSGCATRAASIDDATYQDVAVGYEPLLHRPAGAACDIRSCRRTGSISNTADGSIISNVLDMSAYGRLFLARGDVPGHDGQRMLSEESFDAWIEQRVSDDEGGTYGYGLWSETFDGVTWIAHSGGMVGYTALFAVSPADGLGCIVLQNGYGEGLRRLVRSAFACVRAALGG